MGGRSLPSGPWPASAVFDHDGLSIGGVRAADLAERYGTPLFVVDEDDFRARCRAFRDAFPRVLYAVKAFTARALVRIAGQEGLGLLVATGGELEACLRAGANPASISFHGNNKSEEELSLAVAEGVGLLIADNAAELERLDHVARTAGRRQPVLLRVNPGVSGHTHRYVDTGGPGSKFGTPVAEGLAQAAIKLAAASEGLEFRGLHAHVGSQLLAPEPFLATVDVLLDLAAEAKTALGGETAIIDIGGGFGAVYTDEEPPHPAAIAGPVLQRIAEGASARGLGVPDVVVEPGRALVANSVLTLYRIGSVKRAPSGPTFVAVDGGMSDNIRPALYGAKYTVAPASRAVERPTRQLATVVGKHCESGDVLAEDVILPLDAGPGDLLAFATTGAYGYSMASNYNRLGRPAVVAVREGRSELWLRREDPADLERLEVSSPPRAAPEPPEGVVIRPARPEDASSYLELWRAVVAERRWVRTETVRSTVRDYRRQFRESWSDERARIVAEAWGRVVGFLTIERMAHPVNRHVATLGMAVEASWRGKGVGAALLDAALRWARGGGVAKVTLEVYPSNRAAVGLYRRFGFVEEGRMHRQSKKSYGYEDETIMSRWIDPVTVEPR